MNVVFIMFPCFKSDVIFRSDTDKNIFSESTNISIKNLSPIFHNEYEMII